MLRTSNTLLEGWNVYLNEDTYTFWKCSKLLTLKRLLVWEFAEVVLLNGGRGGLSRSVGWLIKVFGAGWVMPGCPGQQLLHSESVLPLSATCCFVPIRSVEYASIKRETFSTLYSVLRGTLSAAHMHMGRLSFSSCQSLPFNHWSADRRRGRFRIQIFLYSVLVACNIAKFWTSKLMCRRFLLVFCKWKWRACD